MSSRSSHPPDTPSARPVLSSAQLIARLGEEANRDLRPALTSLDTPQLAFLSRELLKILDVSGLVVEITDANQRFIYVNKSFEDLFGYSLAEVRGQSPRMLRPPHSTRDVCREIAEVLQHEGSVWEGRYERVVHDGTVFDYQVRVAPLHNAEGGIDAYIVIGGEAPAMPDDYAQLERFAFVDALTGLPNRLLFEDRLRHRLSRLAREPSTVGAILFIDVDAFKAINDQYGHEAGDKLLIELAQRLDRNVRITDTVSRYGGDEFVLLLDHIQRLEDVISIAEQLTNVIEAPLMLAPGVEIEPRASIGITYVRHPARSPDVLMREADTAMYRAKTSGEAYVVFDQALDAEARKARKIHHSLANSTFEQAFELYVRPVVDCSTGAIAELNLTAMWEIDPGVLSPAHEWIEAAEVSGKIADITCWTLNAAASFDDALCRMPAQRRLPLQILVTPRGVVSAQVLETIRRITLERPLISLVFHVKNLGAKLMQPAVREALTEIRGLGHRIIYDDFGAGSLALTLLTEMPFDGFRLNESFSRQLDHDKRINAALAALHVFGVHAGYSINASGVDNEAIFQALRQRGWRLAVGDHLGPYMPAARMLDWLSIATPSQSDCRLHN